MWRLTACALVLLTFAVYWLNALSAQTDAIFDANGNRVVAQLR
jgi:hypothetical protein